MAGKLLEIHPAALAELGSAVEWYLNRSEAAEGRNAGKVVTSYWTGSKP